MLAELERHPHARAVLAPALESPGRPSHAYLFHGPGGAGKRAAARALAAELLAEGEPDPEGARARVMTGAHPDLTWVVPSGAHEILVSDIDGPVISAASKTPFESSRRVFVIERADELGDEAANRMLKTLEEPASFVHLILLTDRLGEVLPTIRSRCQLVRFEPPREEDAAAALQELGVSRGHGPGLCAAGAAGRRARARAGRRRGTGPARRRRALRALRHRRGDVRRPALDASCWPRSGPAARRRRPSSRRCKDAELELTARKEQKRVKTEWDERIRRSRRRVQTGALDLALQLVSLWFADLAFLAYGAEDLVRNRDRRTELDADAGVDPVRLRRAVELVEDTRQRFQLNVSEDLACEALAYRLQQTLLG